MTNYRYSATVNGKRRSATFATDPSDWGMGELDADTARTVVDNERHVYDTFYAGATDADYDAEHVAPTLEKLIPARWEVLP